MKATKLTKQIDRLLRKLEHLTVNSEEYNQVREKLKELRTLQQQQLRARS